jgi:hypothetical protein
MKGCIVSAKLPQWHFMGEKQGYDTEIRWISSRLLWWGVQVLNYSIAVPTTTPNSVCFLHRCINSMATFNDDAKKGRRQSAHEDHRPREEKSREWCTRNSGQGE